MHRPRYAVITGQGRSGTNWLLELLDMSSETFCRNEPYGCAGSPLQGCAHNRVILGDDVTALESQWDSAIQWTVTHMGTRDLYIHVPKAYLYQTSRALGLYRVTRGPRLRRVLAWAMPQFRRGEWAMPRWLGSPRRLSEALGVMKLVSAPGWVVWILGKRREVPVFHIVRHPGGFLNSWLQRYVRKRDRSTITDANRERLRAIARASEKWANRFGDIDAMTVEESELWYWLYANESIREAATGNANYFYVVYETVVEDPVRVARELYHRCGLKWDQSIEARVQATASKSASIAIAWKEQLEKRQIDLVERFLVDSAND